MEGRMIPVARTARAFTLHEPDKFLRTLSTANGELDLSQVSLAEMWSLAAIAALARKGRSAPLKVTGAETNARAFARSVGLDDIIEARRGPIRGEPGRTVRLTEVWDEEGIEPASREISRLLVGEGDARQSSRQTVQYMIAELLRNVIQHSGEQFGALTGAQLNDRGIHAAQPVYQVVVVDNGRGVLESLRDRHWDIETDQVALERALWPHFSRAFAYGRTGGERNAGLGLFYVSELAKELHGRMLIASGKAALSIDTARAQRQLFYGVGYPGTLVAFEIPVEAPRDFGDVFEEIGRRADQRTPRRLVHERLRYEAPPPELATFIVARFLENNDEAAKLAAAEIIPRLVRKESVVLDFVNVQLCTQSFAHALLYEALRISWATRTPVYIANAVPVVRSALKHVEMYAQSG